MVLYLGTTMTIQHKRTPIRDRTPTVGEVDQGELFINSNNGYLLTQNDNNQVVNMNLNVAGSTNVIVNKAPGVEFGVFDEVKFDLRLKQATAGPVVLARPAVATVYSKTDQDEYIYSSFSHTHILSDGLALTFGTNDSANYYYASLSDKEGTFTNICAPQFSMGNLYIGSISAVRVGVDRFILLCTNVTNSTTRNIYAVGFTYDPATRTGEYSTSKITVGRTYNDMDYDCVKVLGNAGTSLMIARSYNITKTTYLSFLSYAGGTANVVLDNDIADNTTSNQNTLNHNPSITEKDVGNTRLVKYNDTTYLHYKNSTLTNNATTSITEITLNPDGSYLSHVPVTNLGGTAYAYGSVYDETNDKFIHLYSTQMYFCKYDPVAKTMTYEGNATSSPVTFQTSSEYLFLGGLLLYTYQSRIYLFAVDSVARKFTLGLVSPLPTIGTGQYMRSDVGLTYEDGELCYFAAIRATTVSGGYGTTSHVLWSLLGDANVPVGVAAQNTLASDSTVNVIVTEAMVNTTVAVPVGSVTNLGDKQAVSITENVVITPAAGSNEHTPYELKTSTLTASNVVNAGGILFGSIPRTYNTASPCTFIEIEGQGTMTIWISSANTNAYYQTMTAIKDDGTMQAFAPTTNNSNYCIEITVTHDRYQKTRINANGYSSTNVYARINSGDFTYNVRTPSFTIPAPDAVIASPDVSDWWW